MIFQLRAVEVWLKAWQDDVVDAAEDFAVVLLRKTKMPKELQADFTALVDQVINVSEHLMNLVEKLSTLAEATFTGGEEWHVDRLERKFDKRFYSMEEQLDAVTIMFLDKYCKNLSRVSNNAKKTVKYLRIIIRKK